MSNSKKIIIGFLTVLPLAFFLVYIMSIFSFVRNAQQIEAAGGMNNPEEVMGMLGPMFMYMGIAILISLGLLVFYIVDIVKNPKFEGPGNNKLVWILIVLFTGMLGELIYFFVEIMPRKELPPIPNNNEML